MENSTIYIAMQSMMQMGLIVIELPELAKTLQFLEKQQMITASESKELLGLAGMLKTQSLPN
jgi:hypothetical protein